MHRRALLERGLTRESGHDDHGHVLGSASPTDLGLASADAIYTGEAAGDDAGLAVSLAGDLNADGSDDLLVAPPFSDDAARRPGAPGSECTRCPLPISR